MSTHNLSVILTGNTTSLKGALTTAGREVQQFEKKVQNAGTSGAKAGSMMKTGLAVGIVAVGAGIAYSIGQAVAFDKELRNIQSITKQTDAEIGALGKTLVGLSTELPQSAQTLAAGLYDIASSGFQGAEGLKVLEASAIAASAGLTTTEVSAKAITSVLNAYGLEAEAATDVSDILFQAVNVGVVTFEELAGTIGDVVGTAAAATVGIDEVSSAIATMTLSGISSSEAGTSLNRLLQSLIDPSEELALAINEVGYESGAQALEVDSLSTVMLKLMDASEGNIETLLKWFPEIRAARGALALMSDEGRNYLEVAAAIEVVDARQGAARKALNEQMKSVSAQWKIFVNNINAAAIGIGTALLPAIIVLLDSVKELAGAGIDVLQEALRRLGPFFDSVVAVAGDLWEIFGDLLDVAGPIAAALAGLVGAAAIEGLNALAKALEEVSGFLADHPGLVKVAALVLLSIYLPALVASTGATVAAAVANARYAASFKLLQAKELIGNIVSRIGLLLSGMREFAATGGSFTNAAKNMKAAFAGMGPALLAGGAVVAATVVFNELQDQMKASSEQANEWVEGFTSGFNPARASLAQLEAEINKNANAAADFQEAANNALNPLLDDRLKKARDGLNETNEPLIELRDTAKLLQEELGITASKAMELAQNEDFMSASVDAATGELDAQAAAALADLEALSDLESQLKGMYDPLFKLQDAGYGLRDAQLAVLEATNKYGAGSAEATAANQAAIRAAVDYQSAIVGLKVSIADGTTDIETSIATLYAWADAGIITEEQARQSEAEIRGLGETADATDGKTVIVTGHANTQAAMTALQKFRAYIDSIPKTVEVTINGKVGTRPNVDYRSGTYSYNGRWGGIVDASYAGGGIHAHVARSQVIRYAEPETGGEAFVPRRGNPARSKAVLTEAAGWYGYGITPMAAGGIIGDRVKLGEVSKAVWDRLLAEGWKGDPTDKMEALYRPKTPKTPKTPKRIQAEDGSWVPESFYKPRAMTEAANWYGYGPKKTSTGGILSFGNGVSRGGGGTTSMGEVTIDLRGAQIIGVNDLENRIKKAVKTANEETAIRMRKKASY